MTLDTATIHELLRDNTLNEAAVVRQALKIANARVNETHETAVDEGLKDLVQKGLAKVKDIGDKVKSFISDKVDKIADWVKDKVFAPLEKHLTQKFVPGFKWGATKSDADGLIESAMTIMSEKKVLEAHEPVRHILSDVMLERSIRVTADERTSFLEDYRSWVVDEQERINETNEPVEFPITLEEGGAIGAVLGAIHWTHFAVDILEMVLKIAPSIPFLAGLISKLKTVQSNPKLKGMVDWYEKHKVVINSVCIAIGIVEFVLFGGAITLITTALSAGWWAVEVIWHHYKKADHDAAEAETADAH